MQTNIKLTDDLNDQFDRYHQKHPFIWNYFVHFTYQAIAAMHETDPDKLRFSADAIMHRIRWEIMFKRGDDFKVNNNFTAFYARKFAAENPRYKNFFTFRKSIADIKN
jgi:hypothetical protein